MKIIYAICFLVCWACQPSVNNSIVEEPEHFLKYLVPKDKLAHAGVFSPDGKQYYLTLSDVDFTAFDVVISEMQQGEWSKPKPAFFNSIYDEHGVGFCTNGDTLYFSSTRPTHVVGLADTWHIWRCIQSNGQWSEPELMQIPRMQNKLISHPSFTSSGRMYFHAGSTDYSQLKLYFADQKNGLILEPEEVEIDSNTDAPRFTPFVAADESYLLFGQAIKGNEQLFISYRKQNRWSTPIRLDSSINTNNRANPFVSANVGYLYFATGEINKEGQPSNWIIKRTKWNDDFNSN